MKAVDLLKPRYIPHSNLFDGIMSDTYDISQSEEEMIKACDLLIKKK